MSAGVPITSQGGGTRSPHVGPRIRIVRRDALHHVPDGPTRGYAHAAFSRREPPDTLPALLRCCVETCRVPRGRGGPTRREPSIWKYGCIEFHFQTPGDELWLVHAEQFEELSGGDRINLEPWIIHANLQCRVAEQELRRAAIPYQLRAYELEPDTDELITGGRVSLLFSGDAPSEPQARTLVAISCKRQP